MDVAPMVDIVFLLLLFFLLTSQFIKMAGISVELPGASTSELVKDSEIIVTLTGDRGAFINGEPISESALRQSLCDSIEKSGTKVVRIDSDRDARVAAAVNVLDYSRSCGATAVDISTVYESE